MEKTIFLIDGANLHASAKALEVKMDFTKLTDFFEDDNEKIIRKYYFTVISEDDESGYSSIRPLIDFLDYNGYTLVTKPSKTFTDNETGFRKTKGNMDIELVMTAVRLAPHVDNMVLFSGDGDFVSMVDWVQEQGVSVTVVSTMKSSPPMIADSLRRQADEFIDLADVVSWMDGQKVVE